MTEKKNPIRVILVEDYHLIRVGVASYLNAVEDMEVVAQADTGEQGIHYVKKYSPDVILMDLGLPGINGIEATREIKKIAPEAKIIVLTSHDNEDSVIAALGAGANAYCLKDIPSERLVEVIRTVMEGAAWLDPAIAAVALSIFTENRQPQRPTTETDEEISLGAREREVLRLLTLGKNNNEIAEELFVSVHTVKSQVSTILQKLQVNDRVQAAVKAVTSNLVQLN